MLSLILTVAVGAAEGGAVALGLLTLAVLVHETGHALVGKALGLTLTAFHITPLGGYCDYADNAHSDAVFSRPLACLALFSAGCIANALMLAIVLGFIKHYGFDAFNGSLSIFALANLLLGSQLLLPSSNALSDANQVRSAWSEYLDNRAAAAQVAP